MRSKYGNKKTEVDGILFDSRKEARRYGELKMLKIAKEVTKIELQPKYEYAIEYKANGKVFKRKAFYKADFRVTWRNGDVVVEDVKGMSTATFKRKKKIVEALYGIKIELK